MIPLREVCRRACDPEGVGPDVVRNVPVSVLCCDQEAEEVCALPDDDDVSEGENELNNFAE